MCWARGGEPATITWRRGRKAASPGSAARISASRSRAASDVDLARRIMEFDALNQSSRTRRCEKDAVHLLLAWRVGETPTREEMEEAARGALKALGMENAKAFWVAHRDEDHAHLHIVASKINPETGRAYDLKADHLKLSKWAEHYEREQWRHRLSAPAGSERAARCDRRPRRRRRAGGDDPAARNLHGADLERALNKQISGAA